jgi:type II secretory pathway component GspD/PulD (secretin)
MRISTGLLLAFSFMLISMAAAQQPANPLAQESSPAAVVQQPASADVQTAQPPTNDSAVQQAGGSTQQPAPAATGSEGGGKPTGTVVVSPESPKELAEAKRDFDSGVKLKNAGKLDEAFDKFTRAAMLNPHSVDYVTAREITREQLVMDAINRGNRALQDKREIVAMAEFRRALEFDPQNEFAQQRLKDSVWRAPGDTKLRIADTSDEIVLDPNNSRHDFHFRGDARSLLTEIGKAYGVNVVFDDSVKTTRTRFDIEDVDFATAMETATRVTKTFWVALSPKQMLLLADNTQNRRDYERMSIRTFYLSDLTTPQELADMVNALRVVLELRFIVQDPTESTITVRATQPLLEAATQVLESMAGGRPEALLDIRIYQISQSLLRQLGANLPTQFTLFNISPQLIAGLGLGAQNLINQLIASGGINQANSQAIQALLGQLQNSSGNPLLSLQPFATFGGGLTLMGLSASPPGVGATFNLNQSDVQNLENSQLRASQNTAATLLVGERYPIINATYAPIYNTQAIANVIGNGSYIAPVPSVNYEDLGLKVKATPLIHPDQSVTLKLELQLRSLGASTVNGIPIINNRQYSGTITAKAGESSVIAGIMDEEDSRMVNGWPFLARVPGLAWASSQHDKNVNNVDLLVVITPHILRLPRQESIAVALPSGH